MSLDRIGSKTGAAKIFFLLAGLIASLAAQAQLRVEISGVGASQLPIAVAPFVDETGAPQQISAVIRADLARSGVFKLIDAAAPMSETAAVNYGEWKTRGADALVTGSVLRLADERFEIRYRLSDTVKSTQLSGLAMSAKPQLLRTAAHRIADDIYEKLTGVPGAFATRIAYVTKAGREYHLDVADSDGENAIAAYTSSEPIISPAWAPDGIRLAYVSFEARKPMIYVQNIVTRQRTLVANFKGSNSAPAWSPDGSRLAVALSRDGLTQIYLINADGSGVQRLTKTNGIDTEPQFSADGQTIYFTSDRSGGPQIYRMSVTGGDMKRVTFNSNYNISPRLSPDGKLLAFISRREGRFQLFVLDLNTGQEIALSDTAKDESPSFSPNGKYIMYATESGGRGSLAVVSVDGRAKYRLSTQAGDIREPTWGPFMK